MGRGLWWELWVLLGARLIVNTAFRVVYPMLTLLAAGFEVSLQLASLVVTVQVAATLLSPLGGAVADARGERLAINVGLGLLCVGALFCAVATGFWPFLAGYCVVGLGTALFMPAAQAYASNRSSYAERGRVLGFLELSWALAALVGVTVLTQIVGASGSYAPAFFTIAAAAAAMLALTATQIGRYGQQHTQAEAPQAKSVSTEQARAMPVRVRPWKMPGVAVLLCFVMLQMGAVEMIFVSYASWLSTDFGASTRQLGLVFGLLGIVELAGSGGAALFTDRIGKRRAVLMGFGLTGLTMLALPLASGRWGLFLVLFLLFDLCFEFAIVSSFPLLSGLGRAARGAVLALGVAASGLGRIFGSLAGPRLFEGAGFWANGLVAGSVALLGVGLGVALLREGDE